MKPSRHPLRRRILIGLLALLPVFAVFRFFSMRSTDLDAWPAPAAGIRAEPSSPPAAPLDAAACAALAAALPSPSNAPVAIYRRFQGLGTAALSEAENAALAARAGDGDAVLARWREALSTHDGFRVDSAEDAEAAAELLARSSELTVLAAWRAARDGGAAPDPATLGREAALLAGPLTAGAGMLGHAAALPNVMLLSREALMAVSDAALPPPADPAAAITVFREAEAALHPLPDAVRDDWRVHRSAAASFYESVRTGGPAAPSAVTAWFVRSLGGNEADTAAHVDALFSRLVANASNAYSPDGLAVGLPDWCLAGSRPPWTRDPIGATLARNYLRHASAAAAIGPSLRLELRVARIAVALRVWRDAHDGEWPESLDVLAEGEGALLGPDDIADPFAADGASLRYERDGTDGWRLWSVGLDQTDGGGATDAFTAEDPAAQRTADFVFTSRERDNRKASLQ